jgi:hypothetical protein
MKTLEIEGEMTARMRKQACRLENAAITWHDSTQRCHPLGKEK